MMFVLEYSGLNGEWLIIDFWYQFYVNSQTIIIFKMMHYSLYLQDIDLKANLRLIEQHESIKTGENSILRKGKQFVIHKSHPSR